MILFWSGWVLTEKLFHSTDIQCKDGHLTPLIIQKIDLTYCSYSYRAFFTNSIHISERKQENEHTCFSSFISINILKYIFTCYMYKCFIHVTIIYSTIQHHFYNLVHTTKTDLLENFIQTNLTYWEITVLCDENEWRMK